VIQEEREIVKTTKEEPMLLMGQWIVISKPINLKTKGRDIPIVGLIRDNWVDPNQKGVWLIIVVEWIATNKWAYVIWAQKLKTMIHSCKKKSKYGLFLQIAIFWSIKNYH
jgi:hypothetical protein